MSTIKGKEAQRRTFPTYLTKLQKIRLKVYSQYFEIITKVFKLVAFSHF